MLKPNEIQIKTASLERSSDEVAALRALLSPKELTRADRYKFEKHRRRFTVARGLLRETLASYLDIDPVDVAFEYGKHGKPYLPPELLSKQFIQFNVSHSHELSVFALGLQHDIGVDIEYMKPQRDLVGLARRYFHPDEIDELSNLPQEQELQGFYNTWSRKEAFIKALGVGLHYPLDSFCVSLTPGAPVSLNHTEDDDWAIHALDLPEGYAGAIVCRADFKVDPGTRPG